ncbi:hypothetical protein [Paenibacillus pabuli]|uniref:hypothetical protein n=1 Tax=Paenibacillus pabuli TaxID=1472 RepID=UPI001FFEF057|nr:hypothetical protein [Paenibacillus pabuli]UPK45887.1 hypothetical protein KET34_10725 [Paenibacillus pabuli]
MKLRDVIQRDIDRVFFNTEEFAELHDWQNNPNNKATSRRIPMMFEAFTLDGRPLQSFDGIAIHNATVHVSHAQLAYTPSRSEFIRLDGRLYKIVSVGNGDGVLKIILTSDDDVM